MLNCSYPEVSPVIYLDAAGDEDDTGAGGGPDGEWYGQQNQQHLLHHLEIFPLSRPPVSTSMISIKGQFRLVDFNDH